MPTTTNRSLPGVHWYPLRAVASSINCDLHALTVVICAAVRDNDSTLTRGSSMIRSTLKESLICDLRDLLDDQQLTKELHDKAVIVIQNLDAADWRDLNDMSVTQALSMVLDVASVK